MVRYNHRHGALRAVIERGLWAAMVYENIGHFQRKWRKVQPCWRYEICHEFRKVGGVDVAAFLSSGAPVFT